MKTVSLKLTVIASCVVFSSFAYAQWPDSQCSQLLKQRPKDFASVAKMGMCPKPESHYLPKNISFKELGRITFREGQDYCIKQGEGLLDEKEAHSVLSTAAESANKHSDPRTIIQAYVAYANSPDDYGYIHTGISSSMPPGLGTVKPINGSRGGKVLMTQDGKVLGSQKEGNLGLDKLPPEYSFYTVPGRENSKPDISKTIINVFGACKKDGVVIKG